MLLISGFLMSTVAMGRAGPDMVKEILISGMVVVFCFFFAKFELSDAKAMTLEEFWGEHIYRQRLHIFLHNFGSITAQHVILSTEGLL